MCYTYDSVGKVLSRTVKNLLDDTVISTEAFSYVAAGNVTSAQDGNMHSNGFLYCTHNSANRLIHASD